MHPVSPVIYRHEDFDRCPPSCMKTTLPIEVDAEIMSGTPVFRGTRVPVQSLFEYLEDNISLDEFLECFPTVRREDVVAVLEHSKAELLAEAHA
jgi:uncharacterized protein (DUF433 family)